MLHASHGSRPAAAMAAGAALAVLLAACSAGASAAPSPLEVTPKAPTPTPIAAATPGPTGSPAEPVLTPVPGTTADDVVASCDLIGAADWSRVGVDGTGAPEAVAGDSGLTVCVYPRDPAVAGGEARLAFSARMPDAAAHKVFADVVAQLPPGSAPEARGSFDESAFVIDGDLAYLVVRTGGTVLELVTVNDMNTELGLVDLATLALTRLGG